MYEDILKTIEDFPAINSGDIIGLMQVDNKQYVYQGLYTLEKQGKIIRDDSVPRKCWLNLVDAPVEVRPKIIKPMKIQVPYSQQKYDQLLAEFLELKEWKNKAIARYPDLAVSEDVLAARAIIVKYMPDNAVDIMAGRFDCKPIMKITLDAMNANREDV